MTDQPVGVFGWTTGQSGVHFHRITEPLRVLAEHGVTASWSDRLDDEALSKVDTVLASTLHYERDTEAWHRLAELGTHRLVLDVDDWLWDPDIQALRDAYPPDELSRLFSNVERAHVITTPSVPIASYLSRYNPNVWVVHNTVPAYVLDIPRVPYAVFEPPWGGVRNWLGYQGALDRSHDWRPAAVPVAKFLRDHSDWGIAAVGETDLGDFRRFPHWTHPWEANRQHYYSLISRFTVGLGPLRKTMFNIAKSSLRAIEYAALGVVPVLPDLDPYRHVVKSGWNGHLVRPHETLQGILGELARDPTHIDLLAAQARADATNWTTEAAIHAWVEAWNSV